MYKPTGLSQMFRTPAIKTRIPKVLIYFFIVLTYIFGLDFGFLRLFSKKIQPVAKLLSWIISLLTILVSLIAVYDLVNQELCWGVIITIHHVLYFIITRTSKYTVCEFLLDMHNIDENIPDINKNMLGIVTSVVTVVEYLIKWTLYHVACQILFPDLCPKSVALVVLYGLVNLGVDSLSTIITLIYFYFFCSMKYLNQLAKQELNNILILKQQYLKIADCYDKIRPLYEKLVILEMTLTVPKLMLLMWNMLKHYKYNVTWMSYIGELLYSCIYIVHIICAASIVYMTNVQVNALKLYLHNIIISDQDSNIKSSASQLLQYMEARRLQHDVLDVLPVDLRLPVSVFSICTTYMIVIVQFTHLYD